MPLRSKEIGKLYYRIGEVAEIFNVNTSLIRFYENEFDVIKPHRNKKGNRLFTQNDVDNFHKIFHLIREQGYTLEGAKTCMRKNSASPGRDELLKSLHRIKQFIVEIRNNIQTLIV